MKRLLLALSLLLGLVLILGTKVRIYKDVLNSSGVRSPWVEVNSFNILTLSKRDNVFSASLGTIYSYSIVDLNDEYQVRVNLDRKIINFYIDK
jgi:hypothetical protein